MPGSYVSPVPLPVELGIKIEMTDADASFLPPFQATAGLLADGRHLANRARDEAESYKDTYHTKIPTKILAERLAMYFQAYTLYSSVRPFGLSAIIAGWDSSSEVDKVGEGVPALYCVEPSGVYFVRPPSVQRRGD